jgi:hypothetical protein
MASTYEILLLAATAQLAPPVIVAPQSTTTNGTPTPTGGTGAGTETFDAVLGYYAVTLVAGRRYLAVVNGLVGNGSVAADVYSIQIRNSGSASNPTSSSTLITQTEWYVPAVGTSGRDGITLSGSFIAPASGTNTFGVSATRVLGTGVFTPVVGPGSNLRELYVMYLGAV